MVSSTYGLGREKIHVIIDIGLEEIIPRYLWNRHKDIDIMTAALEVGDWETIRNLGRSMKYSGNGYGFGGITRIGMELEQAAIARNTDEVRAELAKLTDYLMRVEIVYKAV